MPITIEAFDVDTTAADTRARARCCRSSAPSRLIGSATYQPADVKDTLRLPLEQRGGAREDPRRGCAAARRAERISAGKSASLLVAGNSFAPRIRFRVSADTLVRAGHGVPPLAHAGGRRRDRAAPCCSTPLVRRGRARTAPADRLAHGRHRGRAHLPALRHPARRARLGAGDPRVARCSRSVPSRSPARGADTLTVFTQPVRRGRMRSPTSSRRRSFLGDPRALRRRHPAASSARGQRRRSHRAGEPRALLARRRRHANAVARHRAPYAFEEGRRAGEVNFFSAEGPVGASARASGSPTCRVAASGIP